MTSIQQARAATEVPVSRSRVAAFSSEIRTKTVEHDGKAFTELTGYASVVERGYTMHDMFGPYSEVVSASAFDATLSANPDVVFLENHAGRAMARTGAGTLELSADATGLLSRALLNPTRTDVRDLTAAIADGAVTEMSFAFRITDGQWSPDYTEYRINAVDLDRGDVSAVTYGANPHTSIEARAASLLAALDHMSEEQARAAMSRLTARFATDVAPEPEVSQVAYLRAALALGR